MCAPIVNPIQFSINFFSRVPGALHTLFFRFFFFFRFFACLPVHLSHVLGRGYVCVCGVCANLLLLFSHTFHSFRSSAWFALARRSVHFAFAAQCVVVIVHSLTTTFIAVFTFRKLSLRRLTTERKSTESIVRE